MKQRPNKPIPFKIQKSEQHALLVQVEGGAHFYDQLHYHPEFQITAIEQGNGIFYAGNSMTSFSPGTVLVIGSGVPHLLKNAPVFYTADSPGINGVSLFFDHLSFGHRFFEIEELAGIKSVLQAAASVFKVDDLVEGHLLRQILSTPNHKQEDLVIAFLQILSSIRKADKVLLNQIDYAPRLNESESGRLNAVLHHTFQHYQDEIRLEEIAQVAHLSRSQFSSFFKKHTNKSYIEFLNELRIEEACVLLQKRTYTIEQVCYEVGFKNVSNFIRQFKKRKTLTPSAYRKSWSS